MIYLAMAILCSTMISITMRVSEKYISGKVGMLAVNYIICTILAGAYAGFGNLFPQVDKSSLTAGLGVANGVLYLLGFLLLQINVEKNGVVLSATFMKLGLLVPMVLAIGCFEEVPNVIQVVGFVMAIVAIVLIHFEKSQSSMGFKLGLFLLLVVGGSGDAMSKVFEEVGNPLLSEQFLFYTFGVALILCCILVCVRKETIRIREILFGTLIGVPNFFAAKFLLGALKTVDAVIAYPTYSVGGIILVTFAGVGFFKEKLGTRQWCAVGMILVALVMLNVKR